MIGIQTSGLALEQNFEELPVEYLDTGCLPCDGGTNFKKVLDNYKARIQLRAIVPTRMRHGLVLPLNVIRPQGRPPP